MAPSTRKKMNKNEKQEALARARRWAAKRHGIDAPESEEAAEENEEVEANGKGIVDVKSPSSKSHLSPAIMTENQKTSRPSNDGAGRCRYFFLFASLPVLIMVIGTLFLNATIPSPPSDHGSGSMFDLIALRYDIINQALALRMDMSWRRRLVEEVVGAEGEIFSAMHGDIGTVKILDLATGTADVAILLGKEAAKYNDKSLPDDAIVLGLDPSENMLNVGATKVQSADLTNIVRLQLGDARSLDFIEDDTFNAETIADVVSCNIGMRNIPEKDMALCEIHRVLKTQPNEIESKLAIMEFSEPTGTGIMGMLARSWVRHCVPAIGALLSGRPKEYMHLQKSIADFPSPTEFVKLIESLKCPVKKISRDGELEIDTFGTFRVKEVVNMNFGSVQIYVATPILKKFVTE